MSLGRTTLKWLASVGAGGLTTLVMALIVLATNLDVASKRGAAVLAVVGTVSSWVAGYAVSKHGTQPPTPTMRSGTTEGPRHVRQEPGSP